MKKTTTVFPEGYNPADHKVPELTVPNFEVKIKTKRTKHIGFMYAISNVTSFRGASR